MSRRANLTESPAVVTIGTINGIDSEICSIGSANIDIRSFSINYELNVVLYCERLAKELEEDFERDLAHCSEFDLAEYQRRNVLIRFGDSIARLLSPLL